MSAKRIGCGNGCRLLSAILMLAAGPMLAAQPVNDNFADRIALTGTRLTTRGSNVGATVEPGEYGAYDGSRLPTLKTVWWTWTAPVDGGLIVSGSESDFPAVVNVQTGSVVSNLVLVPGVQSLHPALGRQPAAVRVSAGVTYQIAVSSWRGESGTIVLDLAFVPPAPNDDFANRAPLGSGNVRVIESTLAATVEPDEPYGFPSPANGSLWWSWTAAESGPVTFQVTGVTPTPEDRPFANRYSHTPNGPILTLGIFAGESLNALTEVTNNYRYAVFGPQFIQSVTEVVAGATYQVSVNGQPGFLDQVELVIARTTPPSVVLTEPLVGSEFIAGATVPARAEAFDSDGSVARMVFFTRGWPNELVEPKVDVVHPFRAALSNLPPAAYYLVARATDELGVQGESVPIEFNVRPANDAFLNRFPLAGAFVATTGTLANATAEARDPPELESFNAWWEWTAPVSGTFTLTAALELETAKVNVFTGGSLEDLSAVPDASEERERVVIQAQAGVAYVIAISSDRLAQRYTLQVAHTVPPAVTLTSPTNGIRLVEGSEVTLAAEATDPDGSIRHVEFFDGNLPFLSLGLVSNAPFTLRRHFSRGDYMVYAVATDNHGVSARSESAAMRLLPAPPLNDAFASRIPFTGSFVTVTGNAAYATLEPGEQSSTGSRSVWWEWTAPEAGNYTITATSNNRSTTSLTVYTDAQIGALSDLTTLTNSVSDPPHPFYSTVVTIHAEAGARYPIAVGSWGEVQVLVARTLPPTVTISSPTNGAVFLVDATGAVDVQMEASDADGTIDRAEIYDESGTLLTALTNEPYVLSVPLDSPAHHRFLVRAFDNHGVPSNPVSVEFSVAEPGPVNDAFADRIPFTGTFVSVTGSTAHATLEPEEKYWIGEATVWWEWTAPTSETYVLRVQGERGQRPTLAVSSGEDLGGLNLIAKDNFPGGGPDDSAQAVMQAQAGVAYPIVVAGGGQVVLSVARNAPPQASIRQPANGALFTTGDLVTLEAAASDADGSISSLEFFLDNTLVSVVTNAPYVTQLQIRQRGQYWVKVRATDNHGAFKVADGLSFRIEEPPPANDDFANRTTLQGWFVSLATEYWRATREPGEPTPGEWQGSVWWSWKAPASGRVTLACDHPDYLAVCVGTNLGALSIVAATGPPYFGFGSQLGFEAKAGVDYAIVFQSSAGSAARVGWALVLDARELQQPRMLRPGLFGFDLRTTTERSWIVEASTNLFDWTPISTSQSVDGTLEFLDPAAADHPRRFYRAVEDPLVPALDAALELGVPADSVPKHE